MNSKYGILVAILLIALISVSLFLTFNKPSGQTVTTRTFYVGVEYAYGNQFNELKTLVDKVKDYTNLFVIGSPSLTFNRSALDESCNYLYSSGLNFIVLITSSQMYNDANGYPLTTMFLIGLAMQHSSMAASSWASIGTMNPAETS